MKPITSILPAANWIMRVAVFLLVLLMFIEKIKVVNFTHLESVLTFAYVLAAFLLVIGGFLSKDTLTIIAGLFLFLLTFYFIITHFPGTINMGTIRHLLIYLWPASVGLYFAASGNS